MTSTPELLLAWDKERPRSKQRELGFSEIGGCRRRAGYRLGGYEPTNASSSIQAVLGTAIHDAIASVLASVAGPDDLTEYEVTFAGVKGHLDRYEAETQTVIDVKTTSSRWLEHLKLHGPDDPHIWQVSCYAAALVVEKRPVKHIRIDYIARDTGECWPWRAQFNPRWVRDAFEWLRLVRDSPVEMLPRDYDPESVFCGNCPFRSPCWGDDAPSKRSLQVLYADHPNAEEWAEELWRARADEKDGRARAKRAAGALEAIRPPDGVGRVQAGRHTLDFRANGLYFVSGAEPIPAVGYSEGDEAGTAA